MIKDNINKTLEKESSQVQIINKPLKLETVTQGSKEDDVLVRGSDNTVKYVPQSEFSGNIPDLNQVLGRGQNAMDHTIYLMSSGDHYAAYGPFGSTIFNQSENSRLDFSDYEISKKNENYEFHLSFNRNPLNTTYNNFIFPQKSSGDYTIATKDDIIAPNMQEVLDQGGFGYLGDFSDEWATIQISSFTAQLGAGNPTTKAGLSLWNGKAQLSQSDAKTNYQSSIEFENPIAMAKYLIPAKGIPGESNVFQIATTDQLPSAGTYIPSFTPIQNITTLDNDAYLTYTVINKVVKVVGQIVGTPDATGDVLFNITLPPGIPNNMSGSFTLGVNHLIRATNVNGIAVIFKESSTEARIQINTSVLDHFAIYLDFTYITS